jgi:hypothetical protein
MLLAGVDEAGYGPRLGPLCVGFAAVEVDRFDPLDPPNLWAALRPTVGRARARKATVQVDDSKRLKRATDRPFEPHERSCRAHLGLLGIETATDVEALARLGCEAPAGSLGAMALLLDSASAAIAINALRRRTSAAGVGMAHLAVDAIGAARFNDAWRRTRSKGRIELEVIAPRLRWVWERAGEGALVTLDRLGGRTRYGDVLRETLPEAEEVLEIVRSPSRIVHRVRGGGREMHVEVLVGGDGKRYPTALASIAAKWSRELVMARFNRAFSDLCPELKPTAGYGTDATRWICEARERLGREIVDPVVRIA